MKQLEENVWRRLLILAIAAVVFTEIKGEDEVGAIIVNSAKSFACRMHNNQNQDERIHFCSFIRIKDSEGDSKNHHRKGSPPDMPGYTSTIPGVVDSTNSFLSAQKVIFSFATEDGRHLEISHVEDRLLVKYNNTAKLASRRLNLNRWQRVCLLENDKNELLLVQNFKQNILVDPKSFTPGMKPKIVNRHPNRNTSTATEDDHLNDLMQESTRLDDKQEPRRKRIAKLQKPKSKFCVGSSEVTSFMGQVAGLNFSNVSLTDALNDDCLSLRVKNLTDNIDNWTKDAVQTDTISIQKLCHETKRIIAVNDIGNYDKHFILCQRFQGRLLHTAEIRSSQKSIRDAMDLHCPRNPNPTKKLQKLKKFDRHNKKRVWKTGGIKKSETLLGECPTFQFRKGDIHIENRSCITELECAVCIISDDIEIQLYGPLTNFDKTYYLDQSKRDIRLIGSEGSIEKVGSFWVLQSNLHYDTWRLENEPIPLGRHNWFSQETNEKQLLTLTSCHKEEFACGDGQCFDYRVRCDGTTHCEDKSDEVKCRLLEKKGTYIKNQQPPPRINKTNLEIYYHTLIYSINDISADDGTAVIDALIIYFWHDPRLSFWNPKDREGINCDDIWHPAMAIADGYPNGFQIIHDSYRNVCQVKTQYLNETAILQETHMDPYMGRFIDGESFKIGYIFAGLISVPCRFNLRKYPFGEQKCDLCFWEDNAYLGRKYIMIPLKNTSEVEYFGREYLGEFRLRSVSHNVEVNNMTVRTRIILESLFAYHVLNSFLPSLLMALICVATFFIPMKEFNERIMVSLTALLVLASLYTQTSSTSVRTPYFKYLDIWFVVLIAYCFCIVIYHTILHKLLHRKPRRRCIVEAEDVNDANGTTITKDDIESNISDSSIPNGIKRSDKIVISLFFLWMIIFLLFFALAANNLM